VDGVVADAPDGFCGPTCQRGKVGCICPE
jgi:hypothetical protein